MTNSKMIKAYSLYGAILGSGYLFAMLLTWGVFQDTFAKMYMALFMFLIFPLVNMRWLQGLALSFTVTAFILVPIMYISVTYFPAPDDFEHRLVPSMAVLLTLFGLGFLGSACARRVAENFRATPDQ